MATVRQFTVRTNCDIGLFTDVVTWDVADIDFQYKGADVFPTITIDQVPNCGATLLQCGSTVIQRRYWTDPTTVADEIDPHLRNGFTVAFENGGITISDALDNESIATNYTVNLQDCVLNVGHHDSLPDLNYEFEVTTKFEPNCMPDKYWLTYEDDNAVVLDRLSTTIKITTTF